MYKGVQLRLKPGVFPTVFPLKESPRECTMNEVEIVSDVTPTSDESIPSSNNSQSIESRQL